MKYTLASDEIVETFEKVLEKTTIPNWVEFKVLVNNKSKKLFEIRKANDLTSILADGINFAVIVNENVLNELPDDIIEMSLLEELTGVAISDTDTLSYNSGNFSTYDGMLVKYGYEPILAMKQSIDSVFIKLKEEEDKIKAQTKGKRGRKPKNS